MATTDVVKALKTQSYSKIHNPQVLANARLYGIYQISRYMEFISNAMQAKWNLSNITLYGIYQMPGNMEYIKSQAIWNLSNESYAKCQAI